MTEQEINIAIADSIPDTIAKWYCENCGWVDGLTITHDEYHETCGSLATITPSYNTDLNAMHEVEKTLTQDQFYTYAVILKSMCVEPEEISATAHQRAETYLRTLNLWKD